MKFRIEYSYYNGQPCGELYVDDEADYKDCAVADSFEEVGVKLKELAGRLANPGVAPPPREEFEL